MVKMANPKIKLPEFERLKITIENLDNPKFKTMVYDIEGVVLFTAKVINKKIKPDVEINTGIAGHPRLVETLMKTIPSFLEKFIHAQIDKAKSKIVN